MPRSNRVTTGDLRSLLRLAGELHELPPQREARVMHMLNALRALFHAPVASMQQVRGFRPGASGFPTIWAHAAGDPVAIETFHRFAGEGRNASPTVQALAARPGRAFRREEIVSDRLWFGSPMFNEFVRPAGVDLALGTSCPIDRGDGVIGLALNRALRERRFGARDVALLQIITDEFGWFFRSVASGAGGLAADLPPQLRRVLERLLAGDSEKLVAARLGLSRHTIHDYVKALYRRLGVSSRPELLVLLLHGAEGAATRLNGEGASNGRTVAGPIPAAGSVHAH